MKYMYIVIGILMSAAEANTMLVTLPSEKILTNRLQENGFGYLIEKTELVGLLAQQDKSIEDIVTIVHQASYNVNQKLTDSLPAERVPIMEDILCWRTKQLIEVIIQKNEESFKEMYE